ncbi:MAG: T9SS type A sorting domain-containing protein [Bacteroidetes bacterium]|nr:T9SS type A sorting domain-containing protein [Bacteroidota bacterium]
MKFFILSLFVFLLYNYSFTQPITNHNAIPQTNLSQPQRYVPYNDPMFNSTVVRISNALADNIEGTFPDYSKRQAWNSNESLMMLRSGNGDVLIYNGTTYQYIKTLPSSLTGVQDIFWHPANPLLINFTMDNYFNVIDEQSLNVTTLHTFSNYAYISTRAEGNMSNNGRYIAMCGYDVNWNPIDFFVYDVMLDAVISTLNVSATVSSFDWISISPLGNFVVVDYADETVGPFHGVEVYDQQFNVIWQKPIGYGHSDLGLDSNGIEVLIMDKYDGDSNLTYINKYNLADTNQISLLSISPEFDLHESCRSMSRPGWVYVSTFDYVGRLTDDSASWLPFEDEVFALKMDGSGSVQRFAHHHSRRFSPTTPNSGNSVYFAEPHATANRTGTKILFGSNWRLNMQSDTSVDAYICDVSALITSSENFSVENNNEINIYPNPSSDGLFKFQSSSFKIKNVVITDITGRVIITLYNTQGILNLSDVKSGIYFLNSNDGKNVLNKKLQVIK